MVRVIIDIGEVSVLKPGLDGDYVNSGENEVNRRGT